MKKKRIYEIAKELNISHKEITDYLDSIGFSYQSHMSPVDEDTYFKILKRFAREKSLVEELEKERERRELEKRRRAEEEARRQAEKEREKIEKEVLEKAVPIIDEAIKEAIEYGENVKDSLISEVIEAEERTDVLMGITEAGEESEEGEEAGAEKEVSKKRANRLDKEAGKVLPDREFVKRKRERQRRKEKKKVRRVTLAEIEEKLGGRGKKDLTYEGPKGKKKRKEEEIDEKKVEDSIRRTMAKMAAKSVKKKYKRQVQEGEVVEEKEKLKVMEFTTVENLANLMGVDPSDVIQKCIEMGLFVTINQRLDFESIVLIADEFGYEVEQATEY
ncbi:MAG TPA: hypothetical protein ENF20_05715, partial [Candidatus Marinimicrobia bacterium]|nr:hypothetical protein [Candidatus Neomarinimicrobiota bacterium]